jgi:hypothetical protein
MTTTKAIQNTENTKTSADLVKASHRDGRKQMTLAGEQADADWKVNRHIYTCSTHVAASYKRDNG